MSGRGMLTRFVQYEAMAVLGREITVAELRLMPYVQYVMVNDQRLDPTRVNHDERQVLKKWREEGHIEGGATGLAITRDFWDAICHLCWWSYVAYREQPEGGET